MSPERAKLVAPVHGAIEIRHDPPLPQSGFALQLKVAAKPTPWVIVHQKMLPHRGCAANGQHLFEVEDV
ncbi:MAG: hypothetical protein ACKVHO_06620 [Verrucomicrobiia bacterium]